MSAAAEVRCWLVSRIVAVRGQVQDKELSEPMAFEWDGLFVHRGYGTGGWACPTRLGARGAGERIDLLQQLGGAAAQGNEANVKLLIQADEIGVGGELGIEDQMLGSAPMAFSQNAMKRRSRRLPRPCASRHLE